jgi:hypothetical protein
VAVAAATKTAATTTELGALFLCGECGTVGSSESEESSPAGASAIQPKVPHVGLHAL